LVDGEVRVCRELVPLRRVFLSDGDEAKTALSLRNKSSPPLLRHGGALLKRRWWGLGVLGVSPGPAMQLRLIQVILQLAFFCFDTGLFVDVVVCGWPDLAPFPLDDSGCRRRAQIREWKELGRDPGGWATAVGYFPSPRWETISTPFQSRCAMGLLLLMVVTDSFGGGGGGGRQGGWSWRLHEGSRSFVVIFLFSRVLCVDWLEQMYLYRTCTCLYLYSCSP